MHKVLNIKMKVIIAEMLAHYSNYYLKAGKKRLSDQEMDEKINSIISLF